MQFLHRERVPDHTVIYDVDGGTTFFFQPNNFLSPRLYVKRKGEEVDAKMPADIPMIGCHGAYGNALFFESMGKIWRAVFVRQRGFTLSCIREVIEGERDRSGGLCSRMRNGKTYAYRMCEDPNADGIIISEDDTRKLVGIHRGKAIYTSYRSNAEDASALTFGQNGIVIAAPYDLVPMTHMRDSSSFIYFGSLHGLITLNTTAMQLLPILQRANPINIISIVRVLNGVITVTEMSGGVHYMLDLKLHEAYFDKAVPVIDREAAMAAENDSNKKLNNDSAIPEAHLSTLGEANNREIDNAPEQIKMIEQSEMYNSLLRKYSELERERDKIEEYNYELVEKLFADLTEKRQQENFSYTQQQNFDTISKLENTIKELRQLVEEKDKLNTEIAPSSRDDSAAPSGSLTTTGKLSLSATQSNVNVRRKSSQIDTDPTDFKNVLKILVHHKQEIEKMENTIEELRAQMQLKDKQNSELEDLKNQFCERNCALALEKSEIMKINADLDSEIDIISSELREKNRQIEKQSEIGESTNFELSHRISKQQIEINDLKQEKDCLNKMNEDAQAEWNFTSNEHRKEISELKKQNEKIRMHYKQELEKHTQEMNKMRRTDDECRKELTAIDNLRKKHGALMNVHKQMQTLENEKGSKLKRTIVELRENNAMLNDKLSRQAKERNIDQLKYAALQTDIAEITKANERMLNDSNEELNDLNSKLLDRVCEVTQQKNQMKQMQRKIDELKEEIFELHKQQVLQQRKEEDINKLLNEMRKISETMQKRNSIDSDAGTQEYDNTLKDLRETLAFFKQDLIPEQTEQELLTPTITSSSTLSFYHSSPPTGAAPPPPQDDVNE